MTPAATDYSIREQRAWYLYDWANSAFATTSIALFLGPYITSLAKAAADPSGYVHPLGIPIDYRSFWSYVVSLSVLLQVFVLPVTGAIADYGRRKRECLAATAYVGAAAGAAMYFLQGQSYLLGSLLFLIGNVSFGASIVIYNSFLPEIAPPEQRDAISSKGWAIGYAGGGLLLALNLLLYTRAESFGITEAMAVRISLGSAGLWWGMFTIPVVAALRNRGPARVLPAGQNILRVAFRQLSHTIRHVNRYPQTRTFLIAYLFYNDAIQTVLVVSTQFGADELHIPVSQLTAAFLMAQFIGIIGALGFERLARWISPKRAVIVSLLVWTGVLVYAYALVHTTREFFVLTGFVAIVLGGSQALSRGIFAQLVPKGMEAEYFSIYEISDKGTSWLGPIFFGLALQFTGSYRIAVLSMIIFFAVGLLILLPVDVAKGERDVLLQKD